MKRRPHYLNTRLRWDILPHSTRRIEANYLLIAGIVMAVIVWMIVRAL